MKGKAGFNLEFLPASYFGKSYLMDAGSGILPLHPAGPTEKLANGYTQPLPFMDETFVSGVGAHSKRVAYGMNRADYSFIPGGIVPGVLILNPDFLLFGNQFFIR